MSKPLTYEELEHLQIRKIFDYLKHNVKDDELYNVAAYLARYNDEYKVEWCHSNDESNWFQKLINEQTSPNPR